jgi:IS5 family transposase
MAYSNAPNTRSTSARSEAFQPTIRREKASRTLASHSGPSPVGIREMSATHNRLGAGAAKSRSTRSGAGVAVGSWRVEQRQRLRRNAPGVDPVSRTPWRDRYAHRAGIEGTIAQAARRADLHHARYRGLAKTHLQHILTALALNLVRVDAWLSGTPPGGTWASRLTRLRPALSPV